LIASVIVAAQPPQVMSVTLKLYMAVLLSVARMLL
jgi:hypothetical protein